MQAEDVPDEQVGEALGADLGGARNEVALLGEAVHDDPNGIVALGLRQADDEIHGDIPPRLVGYGERQEGAMRRMSARLYPAAGMAVGDVTLHVLAHERPIVVPGEELKRLLASRVARGRGIVAGADGAEAQRLVGWDIQAVLVVEAAGGLSAVGQGETAAVAVTVPQGTEHLLGQRVVSVGAVHRRLPGG